MGEIMTHQVLYYILSSIIVLSIITLVAVRSFGPDSIVQVAQNTLTPNVSIKLIDENAKVTVVPMEDGYLYHITAQPALEITSDAEIEAFAVLSFKDIDVKAKIVNKETGAIYDNFSTKDGTIRIVFQAEASSSIPPLAEWRDGSPLEHEVPVLIKSNTGAPIIVKARVKEVIDVDSPLLDTTPYQECKADFEVYCYNDVKYTRYLKLCESDDPRRICEQALDVCGGNIEITVVDAPDCGERKIAANIFYKDGKSWNPGEMVGISFWNAKCSEKTKATNFNELLFRCPEYRLGGMQYMNAGLINP